jgi:protein involved in polysaccharide export with SLBB domain
MHKLKLLPAALLLWAATALPAFAAEEYRLGVGDKLRIKVHEWPDLSGEYTVNPGSTIAVPMIGDVKVEGTTTGELGKMISERLRDGVKLSSAPSTIVEIIGFRPFFVMGDVQRPGEYSYRPGLTVLQAVSLAGGYYRPAEAVFRLERDAIAAKGEITAQAREAKQIAARIARVEAEQKNAPGVSFPQSLETTPGAPDLLIMEEERAIFAANNDALAKTLATLDRYRELYEQEIVTLREQIATEKRQLAATQKEFDSIKSLADKGFASISRQLTTERTLAQIAGNIQGLEANILRARQNISQTEQRRLDIQNQRTARINAEVQQARADAKANAERMKTARDLLVEAEVIAPTLYATSQSVAPPVYRIARPNGGKLEEITVESGTAVLPGDVLMIERRTGMAVGASAQRRDTPESASEQRKAAQAAAGRESTRR